jgi:hypothetical protein
MSWYSQISRTPRKQIDWEAVKQQSLELNATDGRNIDAIVAHVPKYTAVKEGQQHPVGKHGQLKLFHEHVWPKGYTPQRLNEVSEATAGFVNDDVGTDHSAHLQNKIVETMARSTVPTETLKDLASLGSINVSHDTTEGEFDADDVAIHINPRVLGSVNDFHHDGSGTTASQITMHELGHMNDYLSDYDDFHKNNDNRSWYSGSGGLLASPALEGRAEGFRLATTRVTRGMRRHNDALMNPTARYSSMGFSGPARGIFNLNRLKSFRHASGMDPLPHVTETPATAETLEQPTLPGMEKYL